MHYQLEIVMPPTDDIENAVTEILKPFNEQGEDEDGDRNLHGFWDWWVIGGRFGGSKFEATLDADKLKAFNEALQERKVTVSSLRAGKQELKPESQIPMVDALWKEYFPEYPGDSCPMFHHSNNQYKSDSLLPDDVMRFADVPRSLQCAKVIFAGPNYSEDGLQAHEMFTDTLWNGVTHERTSWDETFGNALELFESKTKHCKEEWKEKITPKDDWLVVTVDYHT